MALTPDDVVTKQFQHVRFKEGFDPDEVDDFLDEIVVEWRKTIEENVELKAKLAAFESGEAAAPAPVAATPAVEEPVAAEPAPVAEAPVAQNNVPTQSASIIELAQRLHDEHVAEGQSQRDKLIADAKEQATRIVSEAEANGRAEKERLDKERTVLEGRISELREFERDYRANLRKYIEGQLTDLDSASSASGSAPVSAIGL
ncbi:DivIVA domain-containing protein [Microbacterium sp. NC79]|uniref:DivIVA domain-containing protein n=1 Tax=Microbacterium sp. NC79 TaxID=2851009 RepID=UPI001C2CA049|nr:DivIVA domain-containing protein [Microbacterium sp. NC79]MBV0895095.1 DivIVA domain-containing protein [Microbacterium sp. NC79]